MKPLISLGTLDWGDWFYGAISGFIGGGAGAVYTGVAVSLYDPKDWGVSTGRFYGLVFGVFMVNGLLNMMAFLRTKPLPAVKSVVTTTQTTAVQPGPPPVTVVTTIAESHVEPVRTPATLEAR